MRCIEPAEDAIVVLMELIAVLTYSRSTLLRGSLLEFGKFFLVPKLVANAVSSQIVQS
jgi:hypothetical protein